MDAHELADLVDDLREQLQEARDAGRAQQSVIAAHEEARRQAEAALADERERCEAIERHRDHVHEQWQAERAAHAKLKAWTTEEGQLIAVERDAALIELAAERAKR